MEQKTILLVEDSDDDAFLTQRALAKLGPTYELIVARDGVEALDYLSQHGHDDSGNLPQMVLLDLKLPRIDGLQVLKTIRSNEKTRFLPVMVITSSSEEKDLVDATKFGATSFTVKPTNSREYTLTIQKLVNDFLG